MLLSITDGRPNTIRIFNKDKMENEIYESILRDSLYKKNEVILRLVSYDFNNIITTIVGKRNINEKNTSNKQLFMSYCEDCSKFGELIINAACGSCHVEHDLCCYKFVCKDGCQIQCYKCKKKHISDPYDGWHQVINCNCGKQIRLNNFYWSGQDPDFYCNRYCGGGCYEEIINNYNNYIYHSAYIIQRNWRLYSIRKSL